LARALSKLGYCSRSRAAEIIREGCVTLNGRLRRDLEFPTHLDKDRIAVDGVRVQPGPRIYLMMNKPRGLVTTASDEKGRQTVYSILKNEESLPWVSPVGRLDKASEGLLLLTNDSEWASRIAAPETHLEKIYHVQIAKMADEKLVHAMKRGIRTRDGEVLRVGQCRVLRAGTKSCWLEIVLDEGKNRHIRRIMAALEIEVLRLVRVAIGPLQLGELAKGSFRPLMPEEKLALDRAMKSVKPEV
jgi:23S rRNA pseudouridine2605 synthase